nr:alpha/beta fold hydrolase [uncultured Duganella sp.]
MSTERRCIYLLCGILCDSRVWEAQAQALRTRHEVRVVFFDGHDTIAAMAAHVLAGAPPRFALAGHSMGGRVALEVMRQAPERVERLALLDTGYEGAADGEVERRAPLVKRALEHGIGAIATDWALPMLAPGRRADAALVDDILAMVARRPAQVYAEHTHALLNRPDAGDVLPRIACPTLLLCGQEDGWSPPERHRQMARLIPHSALRLIEACGHMAPMEQPRAVLRALEEWLELPAR